MFDRPGTGERAILVYLGLGERPCEDERREFEELARSAGAVLVSLVSGSRRVPDPRYFVGPGKAEEIREQAAQHRADLVLFNHTLTPGQERNLERLIECRVLDRAGLILDIFAQRARSFEGKLQVELAQLGHLSTRLVRGWTHLERQRGGIGLRGPGETQLETDRRLIGQRMKMLTRRLAKLSNQREQGRRTRRRRRVPTVSLVGYTNAGKSTLFNRLTGADVHAADQLFATLDPTLRRVELPRGGEVIAADTVGFIRNLPHELIASFRSTLQETRDADLLLHVVDSSDERREEHRDEVNRTLRQIGADHVRQVQVYSKIDLSERQAASETGADGHIHRVWLSALTGDGLGYLLEAIEDHFREHILEGIVYLAPSQGRLRARLFDLGAVRGERQVDLGGWELHLELPERSFRNLCRQEGFDGEVLPV